MDKVFKSFDFELKSEKEEGSFEGYATTYGNEDLEGDVIVQGAFSGSLARSGGNIKLFYGHKYSLENMLGTVKATDKPEGLMVSGQLDLEDPSSRKAHRLMKSGALGTMSIGFLIKDHEWKEDLRMIKKGELLEVSLVPFPANPEAQILGVKGFEELKTVRDAEAYLRDLGLSIKQAHRVISAIKGTPRDEEPAEESLDLSIIDQKLEEYRCEQLLKKHLMKG